MFAPIDFSVMTKEVASTLATILSIVFFAYLVELTRQARGWAKLNPRRRRISFLIGVGLVPTLWASYAFTTSELSVLAVLNVSRASPQQARDAWLDSGGGALVLLALLITVGLVNQRNENET